MATMRKIDKVATNITLETARGLTEAGRNLPNNRLDDTNPNTLKQLGMDATEHTCSLCSRTFYGMGHNPEPLKRYEERCCARCNEYRVIPARLKMAQHEQESHPDQHWRDAPGIRFTEEAKQKAPALAVAEHLMDETLRQGATLVGKGAGNLKDRRIGTVIKGPKELLGQGVEAVQADVRSVVVPFYLSTIAACIEGQGGGIGLHAYRNQWELPWPESVQLKSIIAECGVLFDEDMQNPEYRRTYKLPGPVTDKDRKHFADTMGQYLVGRFVLQLRAARIFEMRERDFLDSYRLADMHTTMGAGLTWERMKEARENLASDEELAAVAEYTNKQGYNLPFPTELPFSSCYFAWGHGVPPSKTQCDLYGLVPGYFHLIMGTLVTADGWVWTIIIKGNRDSVGFSIGRDNSILGGMKQLAVLERIGGAPGDTMPHEVKQLHDHHHLHEHLPGQRPMLPPGWVLPYSLAPWMVAYTIETINANDSLLKAQGSSLKERLQFKALSKRSKSNFVPAPYYVVDIKPTVYEEVAQRILSQPRSWSHRWDVRGHFSHHLRRGTLPMDPKVLKDLQRRKYEVYHELNRPSGEALHFLMTHRIAPPREGEWLGLLTFWRNAFVKGPPDKPYVPSVHRLQKGVAETIQPEENHG